MDKKEFLKSIEKKSKESWPEIEGIEYNLIFKRDSDVLARPGIVNSEKVDGYVILFLRQVGCRNDELYDFLPPDFMGPQKRRYLNTGYEILEKFSVCAPHYKNDRGHQFFLTTDDYIKFLNRNREAFIDKYSIFLEELTRIKVYRCKVYGNYLDCGGLERFCAALFVTDDLVHSELVRPATK